MTIYDLVLKTERNREKVVSIAGYYNNYIRPLDRSRFNKELGTVGKTAICCLHGHHDTDPSFGVFTPKNSEVERYSCFGCGGSGDVIKLHQHIQYFYKGISMSRQQSAEDLCRLYNLDTSLVNQQIEGTDEDIAFFNRQQRIQKGMGTYDFRDYQREILELRLSKQTMHQDTFLVRLNTANLKVMKGGE